jgi:molybdopterin molybdotransferase
VKPNVDQVSCDFDPASITVAQATTHIRDTISPVQEVEQLDLKSAHGRIIAKNVISSSNVPNHTNSAMDGYALNGDELPESGMAEFKVVGASFAGAAYDGVVEQGQCVRIMTGGIMPKGTDTVVMQERVELGGERARIPAGEKKGVNVRYAGEDIMAGDTVIPVGTRLGASHLGLIASLGMPAVTVYRRPRIAFFSNGDELRSVGTPLALGEVYDSNRYTLHAMLSELGVEQHDLGVGGRRLHQGNTDRAWPGQLLEGGDQTRSSNVVR